MVNNNNRQIQSNTIQLITEALVHWCTTKRTLCQLMNL